MKSFLMKHNNTSKSIERLIDNAYDRQTQICQEINLLNQALDAEIAESHLYISLEEFIALAEEDGREQIPLTHLTVINSRGTIFDIIDENNFEFGYIKANGALPGMWQIEVKDDFGFYATLNLSNGEHISTFPNGKTRVNDTVIGIVNYVEEVSYENN